MAGKGFQIDPVTGQVIGQAMMFTVSHEGDFVAVSEAVPLCVERINQPHSEASVSQAIPVTPYSSVKIADANPNRRFFAVCTGGIDKAAWIKLQPASLDDDKKGIWIAVMIGALYYWQMPNDNIYSGEISAIAQGEGVNLYVTEY